MDTARSVDSKKPRKLVLDISCRVNGMVYKNVVEYATGSQYLEVICNLV